MELATAAISFLEAWEAENPTSGEEKSVGGQDEAQEVYLEDDRFRKYASNTPVPREALIGQDWYTIIPRRERARLEEAERKLEEDK